jgi:4-hydroxy-tetrahydrodipicolinate reductase
MKALRIGLHGAHGRMGRAVAEAASAARLPAPIVLDTRAGGVEAFRRCDVVIDFSSPKATAALLQACRAARRPLIIGTTGHSAAEKARLAKGARGLPVVWAGNFSVGVNLLFALAARAAATLGADFDIEVVEAHHRQKKDAPSGTAARLVEILRESRRLPAGSVRHGREGLVGARPRSEIGVHAVRGGDIVGDHTVLFAGPGERIELAHKSSDRAIFARGAIFAAQWISLQKPGLYDMQDVLGLRA